MEFREKLLAGGLGTALLLWGGLSFYDSNIAEPLKEKDAQLIQAGKDYRNSQQAWRASRPLPTTRP